MTATTLDLDHLNLHDAIEHDASLTRNDASQGDNHSLQPTLLDALIADASGEFLTPESVAKTRARREKESVSKGSPKLTLKSQTLAYGEAALMLQAFGGSSDQKSPKAPKEAVRKWFKEESLDGYVKPVNKITTSSILSLATSLQSLAKQASSAVRARASLF